MSGFWKIFDSNFKTRQTSNKIHFRRFINKSPQRAGSATSNLLPPKYPSSAERIPGRGRSAYLDLALIFLLFRFSLLILFFLHLALIALNHLSCRSESSNKSLVVLDI